MFLYIDPGTGSMLFTILIGVLSAGIFALRNLIVRMRFMAGAGAKAQADLKKLPYVIFTDSGRYWNTFGPICDEFEKRKQPLVYMTASPDDPALEKTYEYVKCEFIGEGNRAFARLNVLNAGVVLSSTPGLDVYQWKRSRDVNHYAHILHAANDATAYRMFGTDYFDSVLLSGDFQVQQIRELERLRELPAKELPVVGMVYLDQIRERIQKETPAAKTKETPGAETNERTERTEKTERTERTEGPERTVLLAPSWGSNSIFNRYGEQMIRALLETGYHIIVRPHPQSYVSEKKMLDDLMAAFPAGEQLEWNRDNDNFSVLSRSDILISDYSGVMFDFALAFERPVIYADTSFDNSVYDACWLQEEMWTFRILPKIGQKLTFTNAEDLKRLIDECLTGDRFREGIALARAQAWSHPGEGAKRTVNFLLETGAKLGTAGKPVEQDTPAKSAEQVEG